jgi:transmembrane sensor
MNPLADSTPRSSHDDEADVREFEGYALRQDPVELQAALWLTRRQEGLSATDEGLFQRWLSSDPSHQRAYDGMQASAIRLDALSARRPPAESRASPDVRPTSPARRAWMQGVANVLPRAAALATVAAVTGGGWLGWQQWRSQPVFSASYRSHRGQRLAVDLPDGSALQLDASTRLDTALFRDRREVRLVDGQAMFAVASDRERPFHVQAGGIRITVVGTRFSVRHTRTGLDAGKTVVAVESGLVRVGPIDVAASERDGWATADGGSAILLSAGQSLSADEAGRLDPLIRVAPDGIAAWRRGRVSFDDTRLVEALAEFERYGDTGLVIRDAQVGQMRIGGSFELTQIGAFAQALPHLLPVRLERRGGITEITSNR